MEKITKENFEQMIKAGIINNESKIDLKKTKDFMKIYQEKNREMRERGSSPKEL